MLNSLAKERAVELLWILYTNGIRGNKTAAGSAATTSGFEPAVEEQKQHWLDRRKRYQRLFEKDENVMCQIIRPLTPGNF